MIKFIFKNVGGAFFRTLGRFLFYTLIGVIIYYFSQFIFMSNVNAAGYIYQDDLAFPSQAALVNCTANDVCNTSIPFHATVGGVNRFYVNAEDDIYLIKNSSGAGLLFNVDNSFVKGNYYTISIFLQAPYNLTNVTTNTKKVGVGNTYVSARSNAGSGMLDTNTGLSLCHDKECKAPALNITRLTYTFKAPANGNYMFATFTSQTTARMPVLFFGYHYMSHGNVAPTTSEIKAALDSSFNSVNNNINNATNSINNNINEMKDKQDETNKHITSEELPDTGKYGDVAGWLPAGPIDSLINLPLTILNRVNTNLNKSCTPYELPFINNTTIELPCIGSYLENLDGWGSIISFIDLVFSFFILYRILMSLYKDVQKLMSLKDNDDELGGIE